MAGEPLDLTEVVRTGTAAALDDVYVARPGTVVSYDAVTNTATVKPAVKRALYGVEDDERSYEEIPNIPSVPVIWPRAGGMAITFPLAAGDSVLLVFCDVAIGEWRESGEVSEPVDARRHSIGHPFAVPGAFPDAKPLSPDPVDIAARQAGVVIGEHAGNGRIEITPTTIKLGKDATDFVALSAKVDACFTAIKDAFAAWTPAANDGGAALKTAWAGHVGDIVATAATRTKAK